jgi:transcriptional regulator with XRE-family HTH domain
MEKSISQRTSKGSIEELFGDVLKQLRNDKGLSQEELGFESGYHRTYISMLERGKKNPSLKTIFQLAKALDLEPSVIMERLQALAANSSRMKNLKRSVKNENC